MAKEWVIDMEKEWMSTNLTRETEIKERRCIYRVPKFMKDFRPDCYTPRLLSLGPYHHGSENLEGMEKFKRTVLGYFLARINKTLDEAIMAMRTRVQELMDAYDELEEPWTDEDRFIQLMILDGCFLLQFLYFDGNTEDDKRLKQCFKDMDPWIYTVARDAALLENQLPLLALQILAELGGDKVPSQDVSRLVLPMDVDDDTFNNRYGRIKFEHRLHALWMSNTIGGNFLFNPPVVRVTNPPTVTELVEAGVKIEKSNNNTISFTEGILQLPPFTFHDNVEVIFINFMAFEKMHHLDPEIFSIVEFMDCLIDTGNDVAILRREGIIQGGIRGDQEIAAFFSTVTKGVFPPPRRQRTEGVDVAKLLTDYCGKWQNRWRCSFKHLYLANPWVFISLLAAILLLALTILSTVYHGATVLSAIMTLLPQLNL